MGEPINNYYVRIKNAATPCKFGNRLNEIIKDRFICGLQPGPILDRICEEAETTPVEEILETALKKEATIRELSMVNKVDVRRKVAAGVKRRLIIPTKLDVWQDKKSRVTRRNVIVVVKLSITLKTVSTGSTFVKFVKRKDI
ncbi:hypothetical protein ILUMI_16722 [Ignelater luminosus]|uniref:Uncharacterized protein n=1 Tax=Ignelater luminosus TaxID=2038154 RepID=A0A8K0CQR3_IGNLU|nr:hypothetical protein ILUMI_16722 [Ignelater luminosus]